MRLLLFDAKLPLQRSSRLQSFNRKLAMKQWARRNFVRLRLQERSKDRETVRQRDRYGSSSHDVPPKVLFLDRKPNGLSLSLSLNELLVAELTLFQTLTDSDFSIGTPPLRTKAPKKRKS